MAVKQNDRELLRTVMDAVESLDPVRIRNAVANIHPRVKWLTLMGIALVVLLWTVVGLLQMGSAHLAWVNRPTLAQRLEPPYDIALRPQPMFADGGIIVLPDTLGTLVKQPEASEIGSLSACLTYTPAPLADDAAEPVPHPCGLTEFAAYVTSSLYLSEAGSAVSVTLAYYGDDVTAGVPGAAFAAETLHELFLHTRRIGTVGNYALTELVPVDYYFARTGVVYNFAWSSGNWVYTAASTSFSDLEAFVQGFPH